MTFASDFCKSITRNCLSSPTLPFLFQNNGAKTNETYKKFFINCLQRYLKMYLVITHFNTGELTKHVTMFNLEIERDERCQ